MTPAEVKFKLDAKLLALAKGDKVPVITDFHSLVVDGDTIHVGYYIDSEDEPTLWFVFERPKVVGRSELYEFSRWLAWSDMDHSMH